MFIPMCRNLADLLQMFCYLCLVKLVSFALDDFDGILRAFAQAGAEAVTKVVRRQHRLAVYHGDGAFGT